MDPRPAASRLEFGDVTLIPNERLLLRAGQPVALTPKAFDLLAVLAANPGRLLTKEQLMQAVWEDTAVEESNLSYHVFAIRKALGDTAENAHLIQTVPRRGYRFTANVTTLDGGNHQGPTPFNREAVAALTSEADAAVPAASRPDPLGDKQPARTGWRSVAWFAAGAAVAGVVMLLIIRGSREPLPAPIRAQVSPGVPLSEAAPFALSPDGKQIVFAGRGSDGVTRLWVRRIDEETARPLSGTETALGALTPPMFWSPDSQAVAFDAVGQLKRFDLRDGSTRTLCPLPSLAVGGSWNTDGVLIVGGASGGLLRCSATNSSVSELTRVDTNHGETAHLFPWFLPDGRHFLYVRVARNAPEGSGVYLGSLDDEPNVERPTRLLASGFGAAYVPTKGSSGHVIFLRDETLFAQAFDARVLRLRGDPVPLASPVGSFLDGGFFSVSQSDVIAFRPPNKDSQLTWFDRDGKKVGTLGEVGRYTGVAIAPDDVRVAAAKEVVGSIIDQDIWILEAARPTTTRVTFGSVLEDAPVWSADGRRLTFTLGGDLGTLFEQAVDGPTGPRVLVEKTASQHKIPTSSTVDGRFLLYTVENMDHRSRGDLWVLPLTGERKPFPLVQRPFDQDQGRFSPDGRWVAYASNESGRYEVLVRRFTDTVDGGSADPQTVSVSSAGGTAPRWRGDGKELFFFAPDGTVMAADVQAAAGLSVGMPRALFRLTGSHGDWDVVSDGTRFLIALPAGSDASAPFTIFWNRLAQLSQ